MKRTNGYLKKHICAVMTIILSLSLICASAANASEDDFMSALIKTSHNIHSLTPNPTVSYIGGEWAVIGLSRGDCNVESGYFDTYINNVKKIAEDKKGVLDSRKNTEYSRVILALTSVGGNPRDIGGYDLVLPLLDFDKTVFQGINGAIWAKIALDCKAEYRAEYKEMIDKYLDYILENQLGDGGWAFGGTEPSDVDMTAMALCALANNQGDERVVSACDKALEFLSAQQSENGAFLSLGSENTESCAQVIVALASLGISLDDERFVKNGNNALDGLLMFYKDGEFVHSAGGEGDSRMSTEQALCALAALYRQQNNKGMLYDMSGVKSVDNKDKAPLSGLPDKNPDVTVREKKSQVSFSDIGGIDEAEKLNALAEREIINGVGDGLFKPYSDITRAEFAAITVKGLGLSSQKELIFDDVTGDDWFCGYVSTAYKYGIIKGISEREFDPNGTLTREEAAVMICRGAKLCGMKTDYDDIAVRNILAAFSDYTKTSEWARTAVAFCFDSGILSDGDIEIQPQKSAQRYEIAIMLYNMLLKSKLID